MTAPAIRLYKDDDESKRRKLNTENNGDCAFTSNHDATSSVSVIDTRQTSPDDSRNSLFHEHELRIARLEKALLLK
ncbi:hypothetical protein ACA910_007176 [Epithemia clementina (nom. ined.)]